MKRALTLPMMLASMILLAVAAGCLQEGPGAEGEPPVGDADEDAGAAPDDEGTGEAGGDVTPEDAFATMRDAFAALEDEDDASPMPDRFSMQFTVTSESVDAPGSFGFGAFMDKENGIAFAAFEGDGLTEALGDEVMLQGLFGGGGFIAGQAGKTTFLGPKDNLLVMYNASADPASAWDAVETEDSPSTTELMNDLVNALREIDADAVGDVGFVTHNGKRALEIKVDDVNGTTTTTGRVLVYTDPAFPALVELHVTDPAAEAAWARDATLLGEFDHGPTATHPLLATLLRFETMAFMSVEDQQAAFGAVDDVTATGEEWSIQPSRFPDHRATLDAVTAIAAPSGGEGEELHLPLEEGSVENADVRLSFTDADADGRVSTGDVIALTYISDAGKSYAVTLLDEESGLRLTPLVGAPGVLLALALAGVALARRSRG